jgi:hypothetical protein
MLRNRKRIWTPDDDRRLRDLRAAGRSSISIAAALKRSSKAVNTRLSFLTRQRPVFASSPSPSATTAENHGLPGEPDDLGTRRPAEPLPDRIR